MRLICLLLSLTFGLQAEDLFYVSHRGGTTINGYSLNTETGKITKKTSFLLKGSPGNFTFSPDHNYMYVSVTSGRGKSRSAGIETLKVLKDGQLKHIAHHKVTYAPSYLQTDNNGKYLFTASYGPGKVNLFQLDEQVFKGKELQEISTVRTAHCIKVDSTNKFVFVPHTAPNKVYQYKFDEGKLIPQSPNTVDGPNKESRYHEPRHLVFHPTKKIAFTSNESGGGLSVWSYSETGQLKLKETICTLPKINNEAFKASDIAISPNSKFIFIAERDNIDRKSPTGLDCVTSIQVNPETGKIIKTVGHYKVGRHPRCLKTSTCGKFLIVSAVNSSELSTFKIADDGSLTKISQENVDKNPMWIEFLPKK